MVISYSYFVELIIIGKAPYSGVITHGFVLDERGLKVIKSLGNVVPHLIIEGGKNQELIITSHFKFFLLNLKNYISGITK